MTRPVFDADTHTYRVEGRLVPNVTGILSPLNDFSGIPAQVLANKRDLGVAGHLMISLDAQGKLDDATVPEALWPRLAAWRRFLEESGFVPILTEQVVYSETHGFAGTLDLILATSKGRSKYVLADCKFADTTPPSVGPQTAAYEVAYREESGYRGSLWRRCLRLLNDGTYRLDKLDSPADWPIFQACLSLHKWRAMHGLSD